MTFRLVMKEVALEQGVYASFMPKPFTEHPGSGMHTHLSLFEGDRNAFYEPGAEYQLSKVGRSFIAGLLQHAAEITAVTNQWVNSYKRLCGGGEAPAYVCWGHNNRSALVRVPMYKPGKGQSTRVEVRSLDSGVQPLPRLRGAARRRPEGHRGGLRAARRAPRTTSGRSPRPSAARWASSRCPQNLARGRSPSWSAASWSPRPSASTSSTSSCATSAREWEEYRQQVTPFERDRYLPGPLTAASERVTS